MGMLNWTVAQARRMWAGAGPAQRYGTLLFGAAAIAFYVEGGWPHAVPWIVMGVFPWIADAARDAIVSRRSPT